MYSSLKIAIRMFSAAALNILFAACSNGLSDVQKASLSYYRTDSLLLPDEIGANSLHSYVRYCDKQRLAYFDKERSLFILYDIPAARHVDSFSFDATNVQCLFIRNFDSIYVADSRSIYTLFKKQIKRYDLTQLLKKDVDTGVWISDCCGLSVYDDTVKMTVRWFDDNADTIPSRKSVLTHFDVLIALGKDSALYLGKYNPDPVSLIGQDFGTNMARSGLLLNGHLLVSSLQFFDTLYTYDLLRKQESKYPIASSVRPDPRPFDYKRAIDHGYFSTYHNSNAWFTFLYYDEWRNHIYQFLKHQGKYITDDGQRKKFYDAPFSLLVYDTEFRLQYELFIPAEELFPLKTFIAPDGLYIAEHKDKRRLDGKTMYYRFCIP